MANTTADSAGAAQSQVGTTVAVALKHRPTVVKAETQDYRVWPPRDPKDKTTQWHAREVLVLRGADQKALLHAADVLTKHGMALQHLNYGVSDKKKAAVHRRLLASAIRPWRRNLHVMAQGCGLSELSRHPSNEDAAQTAAPEGMDTQFNRGVNDAVGSALSRIIATFDKESLRP